MIHGFHHAKTMPRDCLARSITCTKRASLGPALLALLPLRRLAAATLRERPALLRLDEVTELLLPRRKIDGIGHQNDELLRHVLAHVAHRKPEAEPEEPEEQGIDVLQVVSEPQFSRSNACLNFHHFENSERWLFRERHGHDHRSPTLV